MIRSHLGYAVAHIITDEHLYGCHCIVTPREGKQGRQSLRAPESNGPPIGMISFYETYFGTLYVLRYQEMTYQRPSFPTLPYVM